MKEREVEKRRQLEWEKEHRDAAGGRRGAPQMVRPRRRIADDDF